MVSLFLPDNVGKPATNTLLMLVLLLALATLAGPLAAQEPLGTSYYQGDGQASLLSTSAYGRDAAGKAGMLDQVQRSSSAFEGSVNKVRESLRNWSIQRQTIWSNLTDKQGWDGLFRLFGWLGLMLVSGLLVEKLLSWRLQKLNDNIAHQSTHQWFTTLAYLVLRVIFSLVAVGAFSIGAVLIAVLVSDADSPLRAVLLSALVIVVTVRLVAVMAQAVLAPHAKGIRPLALNCQQADNIYAWVLSFSVFYVVLVNGLELLVRIGMDMILLQLLVPLLGLGLNLMVNVFVWRHRDTITQMFSDGQAQDNNLKQVVVQAWPVLVTLWLLTLWLLWGYAMFTGDPEAADRLTISWWVTLLFPLVDRLFHALMVRLVTLEWLQSPGFERRSSRFRSILQNGLRLILLATAFFYLAEGWGYRTMAMMEHSWVQSLFHSMVDILIITLVAMIAWELIQSAIERRLPEPAEEQSDSLESDGGGAGASRTETLLPLMRSFILAVLVVTVVLSILSSLGVEIGPLLAGAGVVGIAVGFGAQKLVADIISGVFFLLDDAFRRGEYIEAAGLRGTVENISVRSMRLRHHLGAVQTVPYSEIATIRNLSRDWVTMKLEFRLPYDTDVEKVRKIIKKVGVAMMDDAEIGPHLLLPLKSQGVMRVEESALIFRMKFTSKPGEQWVIRREAYTRVKAALEKGGIHFAHRSVHVLMPQQPEASSPAEVDETPGQAVAAAAMTAAVAADLQRLDKIDEETGPENGDR